MKTLSLSEAKMKLSSLVDSVYTTDEEVIIRRNGSPAAVLVSPDEYEGWKETVAIAEGTGIGLFLAHAAVERLGGRIVLANREGDGAVTRVELPLDKLKADD